MSSINNNPQQSPSSMPADTSLTPGVSTKHPEASDLGLPAASVSQEQAKAEQALSAKAQALGAGTVTDAYNVSRTFTANMPAGASGSMPELTTHDIKLSASDIKEARNSLDRLPSGADLINNGSAYAAAWILLDASNKTYQAQGAARVAAQKSSLAAAEHSAESAEKKAEADKSSSVMTLIGNLGGAVAGFAAGKMGTASSKNSGQGRVEEAQKAERAAADAARTQDAAQQTLDRNAAKTSTINSAKHKDDTDPFEATKDDASLNNGADEHAMDLKAKKIEDLEQKSSAAERAQTVVAENHRANTATNNAASDDTGASAGEKKGKSDGAARKAGLFAAASSVPQVVSSATSALDQNLGYGSQSKDAEVEGKFADMQKTIGDQQSESSKTNFDKAAKMVDSAIDFLKQHFDLVKSTNDRIGQ